MIMADNGLPYTNNRSRNYWLTRKAGALNLECVYCLSLKIVAAHTLKPAQHTLRVPTYSMVYVIFVWTDQQYLLAILSRVHHLVTSLHIWIFTNATINSHAYFVCWH